jgi:hypothetical protein
LIVAYLMTAAPFNRNDVPKKAVNKRKKKKAPRFGESAVPTLATTKPAPVARAT